MRPPPAPQAGEAVIRPPVTYARYPHYPQRETAWRDSPGHDSFQTVAEAEAGNGDRLRPHAEPKAARLHRRATGGEAGRLTKPPPGGSCGLAQTRMRKRQGFYSAHPNQEPSGLWGGKRQARPDASPGGMSGGKRDLRIGAAPTGRKPIASARGGFSGGTGLRLGGREAANRQGFGPVGEPAGKSDEGLLSSGLRQAGHRTFGFDPACETAREGGLASQAWAARDGTVGAGGNVGPHYLWAAPQARLGLVAFRLIWGKLAAIRPPIRGRGAHVLTQQQCVADGAAQDAARGVRASPSSAPRW